MAATFPLNEPEELEQNNEIFRAVLRRPEQVNLDGLVSGKPMKSYC